jgi:hypothetical protein
VLDQDQVGDGGEDENLVPNAPNLSLVQQNIVELNGGDEAGIVDVIGILEQVDQSLEENALDLPVDGDDEEEINNKEDEVAIEAKQREQATENFVGGKASVVRDADKKWVMLGSEIIRTERQLEALRNQ